MWLHLGPTKLIMDNLSIPRSLITSEKSLPYKGAFTGAKDQDVYIFWGIFPAYHMTSSWVSYEHWWAPHMQSLCLLRPLLSVFQYTVCVPDGPLLYVLLQFLDQSCNITYRKLVIDASAATQALNGALTSSFSCSAYFFFGIALVKFFKVHVHSRQLTWAQPSPQ